MWTRQLLLTPEPDIIRYPVGPFKFSDPFRTEDRPLWLAQLTEAPAKLRAALAADILCINVESEPELELLSRLAVGR